MSLAKVLEQRSHVVPGKLKITEWFFEVPKDHSRPEDGSLRLFARSAEKFERPVEPIKEKAKQPPWFLYLQGGPGMGCRTPQNTPWCSAVVEKGYKVLLLDQRGTGMSSTITAETLARQGDSNEQAAYLRHFRADSIVKDCEAIRQSLTQDYPEHKKKWSILGQSFGGFCCVNYLSRFPEGLREVFTAGGLPPLVKHPDQLYERLYKKVAERSRVYYDKYPEDIQRVKDIAAYLNKHDVKTPSGGNLSVLRFRQLGLFLGAHGGIDTMHGVILRMANDLQIFESLTRPTTQEFDNLLPFDTTVLYAIIHEACYVSGAASNWSADRTIKKFPEFKIPGPSSKEPILFTAEMIMRDMFTDYDELRPLKETADIVARISDWPDLYDEAQLAKNEVPIYAATFLDDLYVDFELAMETASKIKGCRTFITNTMYHNAIGAKSDEIVKELFSLRDDVMD